MNLFQSRMGHDAGMEVIRHWSTRSDASEGGNHPLWHQLFVGNTDYNERGG
jgi:hypothetical protein